MAQANEQVIYSEARINHAPGGRQEWEKMVFDSVCLDEGHRA